MIGSLLNVHCRNGHRHYVPPRELRQWVGRECLQGGRMKADGFPMAGRCQSKLRRINRAGRGRR